MHLLPRPKQRLKRHEHVYARFFFSALVLVLACSCHGWLLHRHALMPLVVRRRTGGMWLAPHHEQFAAGVISKVICGFDQSICL